MQARSNSVTWLTSLRSEWRVFQRHRQPTPTTKHMGVHPYSAGMERAGLSSDQAVMGVGEANDPDINTNNFRLIMICSKRAFCLIYCCFYFVFIVYVDFGNFVLLLYYAQLYPFCFCFSSPSV